MALWITPPMLWIRTLVFPLIVGLNGMGNAVLRVVGVNRRAQNAGQYYTSDELQMIVQESEELGAIRADSGQMLQELFEFGDLTAGEAMVPRVRITGVPVGTHAGADPRRFSAKSPHTRYPIIEGDLDHIVGMIHIKDMLRLLLRRETIGPGHARPLPLVPGDGAARRRAGDDAEGAIADGGGDRRARRHLRRRHARGSVRGSDRRDRRGRGGRPAPPRRARAGSWCPARCGSTSSGSSSTWSWSTRRWTASAASCSRCSAGRRESATSVRYDRLQIEVTALQGHGVAEVAVTCLGARSSFRVPRVQVDLETGTTARGAAGRLLSLRGCAAGEAGRARSAAAPRA